MEVRIIKVLQVKIFKLILNPIKGTPDSWELVACSYDLERLLKWYSNQVVFPNYKDGEWTKFFKKDEPLEWFNPLKNESYIEGQPGIYEEWVELVFYESSSSFRSCIKL